MNGDPTIFKCRIGTKDTSAADPVADGTGTTLYLQPYQGNLISLPVDGLWKLHSFSQTSLAFSGSSTGMYDVFAYSNSGVVAIEKLIWTNTTTRATGITRTDGVWLKTGDSTRVLVGSVYYSGGFTNGPTVRDIANVFNRRARHLLKTDDTWTYAVSAERQANADSSNKVAVVSATGEANLTLICRHDFGRTGAGQTGWVRIREGSAAGTLRGFVGRENNNGAGYEQIDALYVAQIDVGLHEYYWTEEINSANTTDMAEDISGLIGFMEC